MDWGISLAGLGVGFVVGLTGMGGGALDDADPRALLRHRSAHRRLERPHGVAHHEAVRRERARSSRHGELEARPLARASARCPPRSPASCVLKALGGDDSPGRAQDSARASRCSWRPSSIVVRQQIQQAAGTQGAPVDGAQHSIVRAPGADDPHRCHRRLHRRHDLGRLGLADDRDAPAPLPVARPRASWSARTSCRRSRSSPRPRSVTCCSGTSSSGSTVALLVGAIPGVHRRCPHLVAAHPIT